jgi:4-alpha-glucanotransferase
MTERSAGLLLHPTSLPGRFGIGDLGPSATRFLDWAAGAGQKLWQVLPLGPTGYGNSPYGLLSAFAGNPLLISPERLVEDGLLPATYLADVPPFRTGHVPFDDVIAWKKAVLRSAYGRFRAAGSAAAVHAFAEFVAAPEQKPWLDDWSLFSALKSKNGRREWSSWPAELRDRKPSALFAARRDLVEEVEYRKFVQFIFFRQWGRLRDEAASREISIVGDIPIYVAGDSADVWAHRRLFSINGEGAVEEMAGVPPDYFSPEGQLWGNPLYRWDRLEEEGFAWWVERVRANLRAADLLRIDHFRGFAAYWAVPAGDRTAVNGEWKPGPGIRLFAAIGGALGDVPFIAEDLGDIDDDVRALLRATGFPGMKVLQFGFSEDDHEYQPHRFPRNSVVYTGTHDNDTTVGWWRSLNAEVRKRVRDYVGPVGEEIGWELLRTAYTSVADRVIVPVQDVFCLGSDARMNTPGCDGENWTWRAQERDFHAEGSAGLRQLAELTGRCPVPKPKTGTRRPAEREQKTAS